MSACGTGIPVYRRLQKENTPFAAGILYTNDVDYQLARLLAMEVVTEEPFHEISNRSFERALDFIKSCKWVIDAGVATGPCNEKMVELQRAAQKMGKLKSLKDDSSGT